MFTDVVGAARIMRTRIIELFDEESKAGATAAP
jgi:hypothetical protein